MMAKDGVTEDRTLAWASSHQLFIGGALVELFFTWQAGSPAPRWWVRFGEEALLTPADRRALLAVIGEAWRALDIACKCGHASYKHGVCSPHMCLAYSPWENFDDLDDDFCDCRVFTAAEYEEKHS